MAAPMRVAVLGAGLAATAAFTCTPNAGSLRLAAAVHELRPSGMPVSASQLTAPKLRGATVLNMAVEKLDKRKERRRIVSSENFNRRGFAETKEEVEGVMVEEFTSDMIKELKANDNTLIRDNVGAPSRGPCPRGAHALMRETHRVWLPTARVPRLRCRCAPRQLRRAALRSGEEERVTRETGRPPAHLTTHLPDALPRLTRRPSPGDGEACHGLRLLLGGGAGGACPHLPRVLRSSKS